MSGKVPIHFFGDRIMRPYSVVGLVLIVLGVLAMVVRSVTYFATEHVTGPLGFFMWEVERPHTIFISPLAGLVALVVGIALVFMARRTTSV
jgi:hypothetical protein